MLFIKQISRPVIGITISVIFLALALYGRDLNQIIRALSIADWRFLALAALFTFLSYVWRTRRWRVILLPQKQIPASRLYSILVIGFAFNNILPGRPGEFVRAYLAGQREGISKVLGLASIVVERVADGLMLVTILALVSLTTELPSWGRTLEYVSIALFALALGGLVLIRVHGEYAIRLFNSLISRFPRSIASSLGRVFSSFILGLQTLRSAGDVSKVAVYSVAAWSSELVHYFLVLTSFNLFADDVSRLVYAGIMMVVINLGIMIPAAPGGIGPFEGAGVVALGALSVPPETAFSAALAAHAIQYAVVTFQGLIFTLREGVAIAKVDGNLPERASEH